MKVYIVIVTNLTGIGVATEPTLGLKWNEAIIASMRAIGGFKSTFPYTQTQVCCCWSILQGLLVSFGNKLWYIIDIS